MKKLILLLFVLSSLKLGAQDWRIVSQNNKNSVGYTPDNVWMSPSGNRISILGIAEFRIGFLGSDYPINGEEQMVFIELDTLFDARNILNTQHKKKRGRSLQEASYLNDNLLFKQLQLDSGNSILDYQSSGFEITRVLLDFKGKKVVNKANDVESLRFFESKNRIFLNKRLREDFLHAGLHLRGSSKHLITHLLVYDSLMNEKYSFPTSFHAADSSIKGAINGRLEYKNEIIFSGGTLAPGGRVFDEYYDNADILAITDTLGNKKKVFHASKASFPYLNYDGSNIYFTCLCYPNFSYVQNTPFPGFSLSKLDSSGRVKWIHQIPPDASIVQDTAYRTYIFGHQRNGEPLFGESLGDNELYMAVVDTDGTVLHFEHDSNYFFPNSIYYKLLYSEETGVHLFMSHISPVELGELNVTNDSSSQNMFLARFTYTEPEDSLVGVNEEKTLANGQLFLFPNPSKEFIEVRYPEDFSEIRIFDVSGKLVKAEQFASTQNQQVNISNLNAGFYIIQVKSEQEWVKSSFVRE